MMNLQTGAEEGHQTSSGTLGVQQIGLYENTEKGSNNNGI